MMSVYKNRPWLKNYLPGVPADLDIPEISVNELFDAIVKKYPDRNAINFYGRKITYGELRDKILRFAKALHQLGCEKR